MARLTIFIGIRAVGAATTGELHEVVLIASQRRRKLGEDSVGQRERD